MSKCVADVIPHCALIVSVVLFMYMVYAPCPHQRWPAYGYLPTSETLENTSCLTFGMRSCSTPQLSNLNSSYNIIQWAYLCYLPTPRGG